MKKILLPFVWTTTKAQYQRFGNAHEKVAAVAVTRVQKNAAMATAGETAGKRVPGLGTGNRRRGGPGTVFSPNVHQFALLFSPNISAEVWPEVWVRVIGRIRRRMSLWTQAYVGGSIGRV